MVRKKLAVMVAALGAFQVDVVSALGMGDVSLNSALNQPLDAEIRLLNTNDLDSTQVRISLADPAAFKRSGVEREFFLSNIDFTVQLDGFGNGVVKLTTREPVVEPFLNFLVETRWPSGRLLREYTVLLDLPVFSEAAPAAIDQVSSTQSESPSERAATAASANTIASARRANNTLEAGTDYRVQNDDTLWKIANDSRVRADQSVQQTMVSLQRINPEAFVKGNINRLKSGAVLRLPTETEIDNVVERQAVQEVASQNKDWKRGGPSEAVTDSQLDATDRVQSDGEKYQEEARLTIATGGGEDPGSAVDGEGDSGRGSKALRSELQSSEETLSKVARENDELNSRLDGMEEKVATLQRLLELKDDQLAAMQNTMAQDEVAAAAAMSPRAGGSMEAAETVDSGDSDMPIAKSQDSLAMQGAETIDDAAEGELVDTALSGDTPAADAQTRDDSAVAAIDSSAAGESEADTLAVKKPSVPQSTSLPPKPGVVDQLLGNPLYAGGAGLLVLAIAAVLLMRRRKEEEPTLLAAEEPEGLVVDDSLDELALDTVEDLEPEKNHESIEQQVAELEQTIAVEHTEEAVQAQPAALQAETGDVIAEADIYIAYGRFKQAQELLQSAIVQEPERSELQVKLLQVFVESRDKSEFQQHYAQLQRLGDDSAEHEVKEMLSSVEGVSDWLQDLPGATVATVPAALAVAAVGFNPVSAEEPDDELELDLDLGLDDNFNSSTLANTDDATADFDFDLELDDIADTAVAGSDFNDNLTGDSPLDLEHEFSASTERAAQDLTSIDHSLNTELEGLGDELSLEAEVGGEFNLDELDSSDFDDLDFGEFDAEVEASESLADLDDSDLELSSALHGLNDNDLDLSSAMHDLETTEPSLALDDLGGGELELALDELDSDDLELSSLDEEKNESAVALSANTAAEGLDLDLDGEFDLDDLEGGDLDELSAELSAEFDDGEQTSSVDSGEQIAVGGSVVGVAVAAVAAVTAIDSESATNTAVVDDEDDFDFLFDGGEVATKLDLARAYIDMGDTEGAKDILAEVIEEGSEQQRQEAQELRERFD